MQWEGFLQHFRLLIVLFTISMISVILQSYTLLVVRPEYKVGFYWALTNTLLLGKMFWSSLSIVNNSRLFCLRPHECRVQQGVQNPTLLPPSPLPSLWWRSCTPLCLHHVCCTLPPESRHPHWHSIIPGDVDESHG